MTKGHWLDKITCVNRGCEGERMEEPDFARELDSIAWAAGRERMSSTKEYKSPCASSVARRSAQKSTETLRSQPEQSVFLSLISTFKPFLHSRSNLVSSVNS
jgi:hypothetical protein